MIIFSMTTGTSKGHLNLFKSINGAPREEAEGDKKFSLSRVVFIRPWGRNGLFLQTCSACDKNNNSFHVAIHCVNHDNKIQCFIYSNWSIFMSFEWQAAQFGVHHDPKSCNWQTKSRSRARVEINYHECSKKHNHAHFLLAHLLFPLNLDVCLSQGIKDLCENSLLTMTPLAFLWRIKVDWNKHGFDRHCCGTALLRESSEYNPEDIVLLNYINTTTHHILHWTKLPYQQRDLKPVQDDTTSALWHTNKRCQTWFLLHCLGLCCQRIKHYLKEHLFQRERRPSSFTDSDEGTGSPRGM